MATLVFNGKYKTETDHGVEIQEFEWYTPESLPLDDQFLPSANYLTGEQFQQVKRIENCSKLNRMKTGSVYKS